MDPRSTPPCRLQHLPGPFTTLVTVCYVPSNIVVLGYCVWYPKKHSTANYFAFCFLDFAIAHACTTKSRRSPPRSQHSVCMSYRARSHSNKKVCHLAGTQTAFVSRPIATRPRASLHMNYISSVDPRRALFSMVNHEFVLDTNTGKKIGLRINNSNTVVAVHTDTIADAVGLHVGDEVLAVDGVACTENKSAVQVRIERGGDELPCPAPV